MKKSKRGRKLGQSSWPYSPTTGKERSAVNRFLKHKHLPTLQKELGFKYSFTKMPEYYKTYSAIARVLMEERIERDV